MYESTIPYKDKNIKFMRITKSKNNWDSLLSRIIKVYFLTIKSLPPIVGIHIKGLILFKLRKISSNYSIRLGFNYKTLLPDQF